MSGREVHGKNLQEAEAHLLSLPSSQYMWGPGQDVRALKLCLRGEECHRPRQLKDKQTLSHLRVGFPDLRQ